MRNHASRNETIAAIATAPGDGGVAIIRISGSEAISIADRLFSGPVGSYLSHTAHFGTLRDLNGNLLDEVLLLLMRAPRTFTGEDVVEIHCHGGRLISQKVLQAVFSAGAEPAGPGAFTERAFLNGKIDLTQAEAIQQLICAQNERSLSAAKEHLAGHLSQKITDFQKIITDITAIIEAWVDYPEEGLEFATPQEIHSSLTQIHNEMKGLCDTFHEGKILSDGLSICLFGAPNVGKSSLMNALLGKERAIVTHIPGTTRDLLEEPLRIGGIHFRLIDTAGIRATDEMIEQEGIRRSKESALSADILLFILDHSRPLTDEEEMLMASLPPEKTLLIWNKSDLPAYPNRDLPFPHQISISAKFKSGIESLKKSLSDQFVPLASPLTLTQERHYLALKKAIDHIQSVLDGLANETSPEWLSSDLRACLHQLSSIIGTDVTEDILSAIFSKFCVGK